MLRRFDVTVVEAGDAEALEAELAEAAAEAGQVHARAARTLADAHADAEAALAAAGAREEEAVAAAKKEGINLEDWRNATHYKGVKVHASRFQAKIQTDGQSKYLGTYDTAEEAALDTRGSTSRCTAMSHRRGICLQARRWLQRK